MGLTGFTSTIFASRVHKVFSVRASLPPGEFNGSFQSFQEDRPGSWFWFGYSLVTHYRIPVLKGRELV